MGTLRMIGILQRTGGRKRMRILLPKKREFLHWHSKMRISPKVVVGARYHKAGSASPDPTVYDIFLYSMHWCLHLFHVRHYSILTTTLINQPVFDLFITVILCNTMTARQVQYFNWYILSICGLHNFLKNTCVNYLNYCPSYEQVNRIPILTPYIFLPSFSQHL